MFCNAISFSGAPRVMYVYVYVYVCICTVCDHMWSEFLANSTARTPYIPMNVWIWPTLQMWYTRGEHVRKRPACFALHFHSTQVLGRDMKQAETRKARTCCNRDLAREVSERLKGAAGRVWVAVRGGRHVWGRGYGSVMEQQMAWQPRIPCYSVTVVRC